jgi:oligogalacturonide lyase
MLTAKLPFALGVLSLSAALSLPALIRADSPSPAVPDTSGFPKSWVDPDTGHRVVRLTDTPGTNSLYFNDCEFTPDGHEMVYTTTADFSTSVLDLRTLQSRVVVPGPVRTICMGWKTPTVFYVKMEGELQVLYSTNVDTGQTRRLAALPGPGALYTVNADETLAAGTYVLGHPPSFGGRAGLPFPNTPQVDPLEQDPKKGTLMADRFAAHLPIVLYTIDLTTGTSKTLFTSTDWINHAQFSPTDPELLMYCHEGPWQLVDRIWSIHTDGTQNHLVHHRTMQMEISGHEWWSRDGQAIWYQLHYPPVMQINFLASEDVHTGARRLYSYGRDAGSIHHSISPDGTLFCGDGDQGNPWIVLCHVVPTTDRNTLGANLIQTGALKAERLVNMSKHNYRLEPNPIFTPDQKMILFRSNMFGPTYVFGVEVARR